MIASTIGCEVSGKRYTPRPARPDGSEPAMLARYDGLGIDEHAAEMAPAVAILAGR
jgi:hypothetical protein